MTNASTKQRTELSGGRALYIAGRSVLIANAIVGCVCLLFQQPVPEILLQVSALVALPMFLNRHRYDP